MTQRNDRYQPGLPPPSLHPCQQIRTGYAVPGLTVVGKNLERTVDVAPGIVNSSACDKTDGTGKMDVCNIICIWSRNGVIAEFDVVGC